MIGRKLVGALRARGDEVTVLSRDEDRARSELGEVQAFTWEDPVGGRPPNEALEGRDGVVHLLGEPLDQRWSDDAKQRIRDSRVKGTRNLVDALRVAEPRPGVLVSQSAVGLYGPHGDETLTESEPRAEGDYLADVVAAWEAEARKAEELELRVVVTRTGVVLSESGGALGRMLTPFKLGVGGPVAGGRQYVSWISIDDVVGAILFLLDTDDARGVFNLTAPAPVTNKVLSKTLGRVLRRPAVAPAPGFALRLVFGEMAQVVTTGQRVVPKRLQELGYRFQRPELEDALRAATGR
jgi:uncharacterized protein (TIGR01777 family)